MMIEMNLVLLEMNVKEEMSLKRSNSCFKRNNNYRAVYRVNGINGGSFAAVAADSNIQKRSISRCAPSMLLVKIIKQLSKKD